MSQMWRERDYLLRWVPGGGPTVLTNVAGTSNITSLTLDRKGKPLLAGVVPNEPGQLEPAWQCGPSPKTGQGVRAVPHMGVLAGSRHNPVPWAVLPPFPGSGQGQKHAPTVCMRKLLIILNAAVQSGGRWSQLGGRNYLKTWRDTLFVIPAEAGIQSPGGREALSPTTEDRHAPLPAISLHLTLSGAGIQNLGKHHLAFQKNQCVLR